MVKTIGQPAAIIDCFGILTDDKIKRYFQLGCEVKDWAAAISRG